MKSRTNDYPHFVGHRCTTRNPRNNRPYRYCTPRCLGRISERITEEKNVQ